MSTIYAPSRSLTARIRRRMTPLCAQRNLKFKLNKPIINLTFDDCPKSVVENALPLIEENGWQATLFMAMGLCGTTNHLGLHMSEDDVKAAHKNGHEIAGHTFDHIDANTISTADFEKNIEKNQSKLSELGLPRSQTFAYPYGQVTRGAKKLIAKKFKGAREITGQVHTFRVDLNQVKSNRLYSGQDYKTLLEDISKLAKKPGWMTIFTHDVRDNPSDFGCHPEQLKAVLSAIKDSGAEVMTFANAINYLEMGK